ncbi:hypothetical protein FOIG_15055 [Fusarium odoratissimum NRRL 54006]|uniref:Heterokaryon incompatibility domain-containing protein n=1 Tax=Fusarium odoratissimum (strain NRRL 54006) TaxID=1089451 RepID=X0IS84_FUSO5|nr:uncharacterized protein FOIG_15055 [Fusarium odoratissimum NRRL 54006]EXL91732.1 hypothetical protein FOIG_15055 [Fusarium odoratissimum NRRL 54006]
MGFLERINKYLRFSFGNISADEFETLGLPHKDSRAWVALWDPLCRKWFTRVWVIQETLLPRGRTLWVACGLAYADHDSTELPSWVPDWTANSRAILLAASWGQGIYSACGGWGGNLLHDLDARDRGQLCVKGLLVDSIIRTSDIFAFPEISYIDPDSTNITLLDAISFTSLIKDYKLGEASFTELWHTRVAGKNGNGLQKSPSDFAEILSLLLDETTGLSETLPGQADSVKQTPPKGNGRLKLANLSRRKSGATFQEIRVAFKRALTNRRLGITKNERFGLFSQRARGGDEF